MMSDLVRRPSEQCSPKTSPRGNRSPVVPRQDSSGTLKTTISLGKTPVIVHSGPFYLMKELPPSGELTGATNLIQHHNLEHSFNKFCGRKVKDQLSSFLPNLPGNIDGPAKDSESSLRRLIERPPITSIEIVPLTKTQLDSAFRLHVGPVPEQYRFMSQTLPRKKHKHKRQTGEHGDVLEGGGPGGIGGHHSEGSSVADLIGSREHEKKHKKQKRHDEEKERRKKKKDKKKKKQRHSPDAHVGVSGPDIGLGLNGTGGSSVGGPPSLSSLLGASNGINSPATPSSSNGLNGSGRPL